MDRCLKCYGTLSPHEVDYHQECALEIFGAPNPPADLEESFTIIADNGAMYDLTMRLASSVGVLTLPHTLLRGENGELLYAEKSIDKESMRMIIDEEEYQPNGSCEQVAQIVEELSTISKLDILNFWEQAVFCWFAGCNTIDYLGFSMHEPHRGLYALTPASEFIATAHLDPQADEVTLSINGKRKGITRLDIENGMKRSGIKIKIINGLFTRYAAQLPRWRELVDSSFLDDDAKELYLNFLKRRGCILN